VNVAGEPAKVDARSSDTGDLSGDEVHVVDGSEVERAGKIVGYPLDVAMTDDPSVGAEALGDLLRHDVLEAADKPRPQSRRARHQSDRVTGTQPRSARASSTTRNAVPSASDPRPTVADRWLAAGRAALR